MEKSRSREITAAVILLKSFVAQLLMLLVRPGQKVLRQCNLPTSKGSFAKIKVFSQKVSVLGRISVEEVSKQFICLLCFLLCVLSCKTLRLFLQS